MTEPVNVKNKKPNKKQLDNLAKQIEHDEIQTSPAEKRVKINESFKKAVMKMVQTPPDKQGK
jgi:hypothetical protein